MTGTQHPPIVIPRTVKRNTLLLAVTQAMVNAALQLVPTVATLIMFRMTGLITLVGLVAGINGLTRVAISYPAGKIADSFGRRASFSLGFTALGIGGVMIFYSVIANDIWVFIAGLVLNAVGRAISQQLRLAATDMYPVERKGEGISYIMTGSAFGAIGGPLIIIASGIYSDVLGIDEYASPWLFSPAIAAISVALILAVRPDPLEIARNLDKYYPSATRSETNNRREEMEGSIAPLISYYPVVTALLVSSLAWGIMSMMMVLVSVILSSHGVGLEAISVAVAIHVLGMYAFSIPFGRLTDKIGRRGVLLLGATTSGIGALATSISQGYWIITLGIFLVGLGWSASIVASTALLGDVVPPAARGRIMGLTDLSSGVFGMLFPLVGGFIADFLGFLALGITGLATSLPVIFFATMLRETSPGTYRHRLLIPANR